MGVDRIVAAVVVVATLSGCARPEAVPAEAPPNLLLISIDALRADGLGSYGNPRPTSPFLDRLAERGVRFTRAFVNTHGTTPSHATMLSSRSQEHHRIGFEGGETGAVPEALPLVQELFRERGYLTVGVTGGGNAGGKFGFARGFEVWNDRARTARAGVERLLGILRKRVADERPRFVFFHTYQVHSPYLVPPQYETLFGESESDFVPSSENLVAYANNARALSEEDLEFLRARYDEGVRVTDDALADLFAELDRIGFLERAIVVVTADHGEEFGEHGGLLHRGLLFDELLHVPLIVAGKGIEGGRVDPRMASTLDVAPTLLGCAGLEVPAGMEGHDLLCGATGPDESENVVVSQYRGLRYSVRTPEWKLVFETDPPELRLFDLVHDPGEHEDVAAREPERVEELRGILRRWRATMRPLEHGAEAELGPEEIEHLKALGYL